MTGQAEDWEEEGEEETWAAGNWGSEEGHLVLLGTAPASLLVSGGARGAGGPCVRGSQGQCCRAVGSSPVERAISQRPVTWSLLRAAKQLYATHQLIH